MNRFLLNIFIALFILSFGTVSLSKPTHLIPCDELFERSPVHKIYHHHLLKQLYQTGLLETVKIKFNMVVMPSFRPEHAIVAYEIDNGRCFIEKLTFQESVWDALNKTADQKGINIHKLHIKGEYALPDVQEFIKRPISPTTLKNIEAALQKALQLMKFDKKELETGYTYLDGTSIYFISGSNKCGWPFPDLEEGSAKQILKLGELLESFLSGSVTEAEIRASARKLFSN
jgi:hypothetical protein